MPPPALLLGRAWAPGCAEGQPRVCRLQSQASSLLT